MKFIAFAKYSSYRESGKIALAFLLGYFDGDGHLYKGMTVQLYSADYSYLEKIRILYESKNIVRTRKKVDDKKRPQKTLYLGADLYDAMLRSFSGSMKRKRPINWSPR